MLVVQANSFLLQVVMSTGSTVFVISLRLKLALTVNVKLFIHDLFIFYYTGQDAFVRKGYGTSAIIVSYR